MAQQNMVAKLMFQSSSFQDYQQIFNARGELYHRAMQAQPFARRNEFEKIIGLANIQSGSLIADIPAGGGYLRAFVPSDVRLVAVETSDTFLRQNQISVGDSQVLCSSLDEIPLPSDTFNHVLSLAGAHHLCDKPAFYREVWRLLKPDSVFVLADVKEGSRVAHFLNEWVNTHNSMGHQGVFLNRQTTTELRESGFSIESANSFAYNWEFGSVPEMVQYCRFLFGIDLADDEQILKALETILGVEEIDSRVCFHWELLFIRAAKSSGVNGSV